MFARAIGCGVLYFVIVFAVGFALGILRVGILEPQLGTRWAELLEMPLMLIAILLTARWIVRKTQDHFLPRDYISIGLVALALLLSSEATLVLWLRGISISEYIASRDPVSGTAYLVSLLVFAAVPILIYRITGSNNHGSMGS